MRRSRDRTDAPAPDDPRKAGSPTQLSGPFWSYVLRRSLREFVADECTDSAASLTFFAVLAVFPAGIALISLLGVFGLGEAAAAAVLRLLGQTVPDRVVETVRGPLEEFVSSPSAGLGLVTGLVLSVWFASRYVSGFARAMNRVYQIDEGRPYWRLKPMQLLLTVIGMVLVLALVVLLVVSGPVATAIGDLLGLQEQVRTVWSVARWPVIALILVAMLWILYYGTPNVRQPKWGWMSPGAVLALAVLLAASFLFDLYLSRFADYSRYYGPLAGVVAVLLWLWIANLALLLGAEFNAELERARQLMAGIAAEATIQLPPRDSRRSDKAAARELADELEGRRLRLDRGREGRDRSER